MNLEKFVTGIQHVGIPTNDIEKTISFYNDLGFEAILRTANSQEKVCFLQMQNLVIETYQNHCACGKAGAIDHIALNVTDIDEVFQIIQKGDYKLLDVEIQSLPFWEQGVRFFTIEGPNSEKIEFNQKL